MTFVQLAQIGKGCVVEVGLESFWGVGWVFTFLEHSHMSKAMEAGSEQTAKKTKKADSISEGRSGRKNFSRR